MKKVKMGNREYFYNKEKDGKETLTRNEIINGRNIEIVLKGDGNANPNEIEKFIVDVLSDQYIQNNIKSVI